jgi:hypothetical protein
VHFVLWIIHYISPIFKRAIIIKASFSHIKILFCPCLLQIKLSDMNSFLWDLCGQNCDGFVSAKLEELLGLMIEVLPSCHFSAKRHRLDCLYFLIVHVAKVVEERSDIIIIGIIHLKNAVLNSSGFKLDKVCNLMLTLEFMLLFTG